MPDLLQTSEPTSQLRRVRAWLKRGCSIELGYAHSSSRVLSNVASLRLQETQEPMCTKDDEGGRLDHVT